MLVQVIHELAHVVLEGAGDRDVVEDREVLDVLAQADAARVRADRHPELLGHQEDGEHLVDAGHPAGVDLDERGWRPPAGAA